MVEEAKKFIIENKRTILTGLSCAGVAGTTIAVHHDTKKAIKKEEELFIENEPFKTRLKNTWKCYIPSVLMSSLTIGAILAKHYSDEKDIQAIAMVGTMAVTALDEFKNTTKEAVGEEKYNDILEASSKKNAPVPYKDNIPVATQDCIGWDSFGCGYSLDRIVEGDKPVLIYDEFTREWFRTPLSMIYLAKFHLNRNFQIGPEVSLYSFYELCGLEPADIKDEWAYSGWCAEWLFEDQGSMWIDIRVIKATDPLNTGEEYYILSYDTLPCPFDKMLYE